MKAKTKTMIMQAALTVAGIVASNLILDQIRRKKRLGDI